MDDDEARYLIDQYNKLVSWAHLEDQIFLSSGAVFAAMMALRFSAATLAIPGFPREGRHTIYFSMANLVAAVALLVIMFGVVTQLRLAEHRRKLLLEDYRSKTKLLPSTITLKTAYSELEAKIRELLGLQPPPHRRLLRRIWRHRE